MSDVHNCHFCKRNYCVIYVGAHNCSFIFQLAKKPAQNDRFESRLSATSHFQLALLQLVHFRLVLFQLAQSLLFLHQSSSNLPCPNLLFPTCLAPTCPLPTCPVPTCSSPICPTSTYCSTCVVLYQLTLIPCQCRHNHYPHLHNCPLHYHHSPLH